MKRTTGVIIYTILIVALVALVVFSSGNNPPQQPPVNSTTGGSNLPPANGTVNSLKVSAEELAAHDSQDDCWIGYKGKVYDITDWLPRHPGSAGAIAPYCGTANEFEDAFTGQHGESQVGRLMEEGEFKGEIQ